MKIERRNLEDFPSKFAVKPRPVLNTLIINQLENCRKFCKFVKIFYHFRTATILYFYAIFGADTVGAEIKEPTPPSVGVTLYIGLQAAVV